MFIRKLLFFACLTFEFSASAKLLVITHSYNRPDFIEIQHKTFKKFLKDEYEFVVFNDARDIKMWESINSMCKKLKIRCVSIPQKIHDRGYLPRVPGDDFNGISCRVANVIQFSLDKLGFIWNDYVTIIDSDMFLIKPLSIREYMNGYLIAGVPQTRGKIDYLWNGLLFFDMPNLPNKQDINFNCGIIQGQRVDTGGYTYNYFQKNLDIKVNYINHVLINSRIEDKQISKYELQAQHQAILDFVCVRCNKKTYSCPHANELFEKHFFNQEGMDLIKSDINDVEFLCNASFFHYRSGANWNGKSTEYHRAKSKKFNDFISLICSSDN
jgi:hypothetical protein